ncbi:MAG: acyl carrier protein [Lachnospiraceae bacterium]|nr:acyl carrier protein [Lachnospiraceae bacterium]
MIYDKLVEILHEVFGFSAQELSKDISFKDDLAVDSLDIYKLVMTLEEEFNIDIPDESVKGIETIADLIRVLKELGVED